jgi:hypothetical protein
MKLKFSTIILTCLALVGCLLPDDYSLELSMPDPQQIAWTFDGKWQLVLPGFDPRRNALPPADVAEFTRQIMNIPGSKSGSFEKATTWRHSIAWSGSLIARANQPAGITFPGATAPDPMDAMWILKIITERPGVVTIRTPNAADPQTLREFTELGYKSKGVFTLKTPARVDQISGPPLSKSWFGKSYSTNYNLLTDQPIAIRLTF